MKKIIALNPKNQKAVDKVLKYNYAYDKANDLRDKAADNDNQTQFKKYSKICEQQFDKYLEALAELPKGEQKNIEKKLY